jgi:predicted amidohydrolase
MKNFKLALVQYDSKLRQTQKNLEKAVAWIRKAKRKGADLVCLPELCITGHGGHDSMIADAQPVPDGPACRVLIDLAADLNIHISAGIAELEGPSVYNCQFIVGPGGYLGKQRKVHLSRDEYFYFRHGTDMPVIDLPFVKVGMIICYDNSIPEIARCLALKGAELLLAPHAARTQKTWPRSAAVRRKILAQQKEASKVTHRSRAIDNACYVGFCNMAGQGAAGIKGVVASHMGGCLVVGPDGAVLDESRSRDVRDEMIVTPLRAEPLHKIRISPCLPLRVRRPEVFSVLTEPTT